MEKSETYWSRFAADFDARNQYVVGTKSIEIIRDALVQQRLSGDVLELGCGNGFYSREIASSGCRLIASDYSDEMIEAAANRLQHIRNITVEKQNCFSLSFDNSRFDYMVMINLLHVIPEPEKALAECRRVLKTNGGLIVISFTMEGMGLFQKIGLMFRYFRTYGKPPAASRTLNLERARRLAENAGFKVTESRLIGRHSKALFIKAKHADAPFAG